MILKLKLNEPIEINYLTGSYVKVNRIELDNKKDNIDLFYIDFEIKEKDFIKSIPIFPTPNARLKPFEHWVGFTFLNLKINFDQKITATFFLIDKNTQTEAKYCYFELENCSNFLN